LKERSSEKELLDLGLEHYSQEEYEDCLKKLDQVGRWLGGDRATFSALSQLKRSPNSILDIGCGGGFMTKKLADRYPEAQVVGVDRDPAAIAFAKRHQAPNLRFEHRNMDSFSDSYDVVMATLVCHHMSDAELVSFIKDVYLVANQSVIFNDLHRHSFAYGAYAVLAPLLFHNRLITHDGLLSIKRSFKRKDWFRFFEEAAIPSRKCSVSWHFPFRWIVRIACQK